MYIYIDKIVVSNKVSFVKIGFKYFIGYKDAKKIGDFCIFLLKMSAYRKDFDETKYISFLREDNELLKKCSEICKKVKNSLKKEFDWEPVYHEKYLKAKIKSYNGKINTTFYDKEGSQFIFCISNFE